MRGFLYVLLSENTASGGNAGLVPSGINTGLAPSGINTGLAPSGINTGLAPSRVNTGPAKRDKYWARAKRDKYWASDSRQGAKSWFFIPPLPAFGHLPPQAGEGIFSCNVRAWAHAKRDKHWARAKREKTWVRTKRDKCWASDSRQGENSWFFIPPFRPLATFPRKRGKGLFRAMFGLGRASSGINTGLAKRDKCWARAKRDKHCPRQAG